MVWLIQLSTLSTGFAQDVETDETDVIRVETGDIVEHQGYWISEEGLTLLLDENAVLQARVEAWKRAYESRQVVDPLIEQRATPAPEGMGTADIIVIGATTFSVGVAVGAALVLIAK